MAETRSSENTPEGVLNKLAAEKGVRNTLMLSADGLVVAVSDGFAADYSDPTAANLSAIQSLCQALAPFFNRPTDDKLEWKHTIANFDGGCVLVFGAGDGACVGVSMDVEFTDPKVSVVTAATVQAIKFLEPLLSVEERASAATLS